MKFIFPFLFTLLLLASCAESTDHPRPKYDDAENDREFYNFSGAVKSMKRYRTISPKQGHVYESVPQWFMKFTKDGKIIKHVDRFNFWKWSSMALGLPGMLLGFTPIIKNGVRKNVHQLLKKYMEK